MAAHSKAHGGAMTQADLAAYAPLWVKTISKDFANHELHEIPPNGQGITALIALGILKHTPFAETKVDSADWQHWQIEAIKLAFADVYAHVADASTMRIMTEQMLDDTYLASRAKLIKAKQAQQFSAGTLPMGGTIYLTTADENGMMVSLIQSNYMGFGSGVVMPGYGISMQNRGHGFSLDAKSANVVAPGKRPFHTIIPGFLMKDGQAKMSFGVMGGNMQPQGHVQTLSRMLIAGQQPQAACDAPRWKFMQGVDIEVEAAMPAAVLSELAARGHKITQANDSYMDFGSGQFIWRLGNPKVDGYVAASDSRRDGQAVGF
jgi:gamma-glutamyltranspeptidase / glutathione hydrolase